MPVVEHAPAKVNLALHVLRRRPDGYHELDSLVAFVPQAADRLMLSPVAAASGQAASRLLVRGPFAGAVPKDGRNLALRAARLMVERWPDVLAPVNIVLEKNLPAAAGIGGGSADAAAVLRGMCNLFGVRLPPREQQALALELGADVPVCLLGRAARMRGVGECLYPLDLPSRLPVLLCNPGVAVSTAEVFARLANLRTRQGVEQASGMSLRREDFASGESLIRALIRLRNDLERPACKLAPEIGACLRELRTLPGVRLARMSGSGATCFALFDEAGAATIAERHLRQRHPLWWVVAGFLR